MTVYWVVWDAAAEWIVDRLDREGRLPALRRLRAAGARAAARPPAPNCQTPPSLATLFTGTRPAEHGVTGFTVPGGPPGPVEYRRSGFGPEFPHRPPVWRLVAAHGGRTALVHVPWVFDADGAVGPGVDAAVEAYSRRLAGPGVLPVLPGGRYRWPAGPADAEVAVDVEVTADAGRVRLRTGTGTHEIPAGGGWVPVRLGDGTGFWTRLLTGGPAADGAALLARTGTWQVRVAGSDHALVERCAAAEVFAGTGVGSLYRAGRFGPRLAEGGDGSAEEVFVSSLGCVARSFTAAADAVLAGHHADLVVIYLPLTDDVGHELVGWCDRLSAGYRPELAGVLWEQVARCYSWADALLGRVLDRSRADRGSADTVLLSADHGMVGSAHLVHLNEALIQAGMAVAGPDGGLDPRRSAVVYHPANNGTLRVNHDQLPGGVVPRDRAGAALRAAMAALTALTPAAAAADPRVVTGFLDQWGAPLRPDSVGGRDDTAYVVLHDDYQPSAAVDGGAVIRAMPKSAAHVVNTGTSRLHATFAAAGPGIEPGTDLGVVDNTVGARLVLRRLGIDPPGPAPLVAAGAAGRSHRAEAGR